MTSNPREDRIVSGDPKGALSLFAKDESGMMTIFACFMILIMLMVGGIGVDLMRNEMERTRLQSVADRAVLAAADLDQELDPSAVVQDYFDKSGMGDYVSSVTVDQGLNYRTVTVDATTSMNTQFMSMLGVDTLSIPARARAEEKVNKVEISMVLDISGSMNTGTKMQEMQDAASEFIDSVLTTDTEDLISINLVPYSQHVNAGEQIFNRMNIDQTDNYGDPILVYADAYCIEFDNSDFNSVVLDTSKTYDPMQHFQWNYYSIESGNQTNTMHDTMCPRNDYEAIVPMSQNAAYLKSQINQLQPRAGTQIFLGMKWAAAMLDPSFRSINTSLVSAGHVDNVFSGRPVAYSDDETLKTIVLMTDGQNSSARRITDYYYRTDSLRAHWASNNFTWYVQRYLRSNYNRYSYTKYSEATGDSLLSNMCDAAKDQNIVIWSIGFEVQDHGANVMRDCASSPSHFFRVEGVEISDAFDAIARQINQLRLTQ
jgi:Flp pilus assembly protein TadG